MAAARRSSVIGGVPILQGIVEKKPSKGVMGIKRYQKRWFELSGHYLRYFGPEAAGGVRDMSTLKGAVNLHELVRVEARPNGVEIVLEIAEGDRLLELRIADKAVCMQWVEALQKHVPDAGAVAGANSAGSSAVARAVAPPAAPAGGQNEI